MLPIERTKTAEEIFSLRSRMVDNYCSLSRVRPGNGYGPTVSRCVEYINRCRIDAAKRLLLVHADDLSQIALSVGFSDARYFFRVFKKFEGVAPSVLRGRPAKAHPAAQGADQADS